MCPSLDEKPTDWRNNFSVFGNDVTRRDFIKGSIAAGAVVGGGLGAFYFGYSSTLASPVRVGVIGTGDQGAVLIGALNPNFVQVKSIADLRSYNQWRAFHGDSYENDGDPRPGLMAKYGWKTEDAARKKVAVYNTYRNLLDNAKKDRIEAVIVALPLHLHAEAAVAALKAGLHVFTEKMMADTTYKCKEMARAAQTAKKVLAVGHQRHYNLLYAKAAESIASGMMGKLHYVRAQYHVPKPALPLLPGTDDLTKLVADWQAKADAASGREIDVWTKRMAQIKQQNKDKILDDDSGYGGNGRKAADELLRWRFYDALSRGLFAEVLSQQIDAANIFIAAAWGGTMQYPLNIVAAANRPLRGAAGDVADHISCILEYPTPEWEEDDSIKSRKRIGVQCAVVNGNAYGGSGEIAYGEKLAVILEKEKDWSVGPASGSATKSSIKAGKGGGPTLDTQASAAGPATKLKGHFSRGYVEELEHWAWCIRHRSPKNQSRANAEVGLANAVTALAAKESAKQNKSINFDPDWFEIDSDVTLEGKKPDLKRYD